ncbi:ferredoxin-type protein NapF [Sulfurimonas paralvinellae]|uniref:Ferredoxin-type protein NapF n=1 Tax=Sulfurimonas paralvinellae TaxID=317658 RepID=A0A7M1B6K1_9BACT|nr:ferredoxin-type protein NapF [Sulfurimonas paralvinellae]QOP45300.1 ferredoxin-type protein NapF [Sulfurimonas paralvinellae]
MERRELFSFLSSSVKEAVREQKDEMMIIRPPYYSDVDAFVTECQNCEGECASLCQEQIIVITEDKTPQLVFNSRGCTYCDECAVACPSDVLLVENKHLIEASIVINKNKCLSWQGVMCFSCKDPCLENAIDFKAMFMPEINDKCTNCGFCIGRCPADAIDIKKVS